MPKLLIRSKKKQGKVMSVTPASAKWKYVGHDVWKLAANKIAKGHEAKRETCIVFISGKGAVKIDGQDFGVIGERMSVFDGKPWSVYIPPKAKWSVTAHTDCVINVSVQHLPRANMVPLLLRQTRCRLKLAAKAPIPDMSATFCLNRMCVLKAFW
jgi:5-deoxy-D-glucuronate isomerase